MTNKQRGKKYERKKKIVKLKERKRNGKKGERFVGKEMKGVMRNINRSPSLFLFISISQTHIFKVQA